MEHKISKSKRWAGHILSGIVIFFMVFDGVFKLIQAPEAIDGTVELGYGAHHLMPLGVIALVCTALYALPPTAVLGAVLLTGYYGGAIATHFRIDNPLFTHLLFPVYLGLMMWGGLWLRNAALQQLLPLKKTS